MGRLQTFLRSPTAKIALTPRWSNYSKIGDLQIQVGKLHSNVTTRLIPSGGSTGQVLSKTSGTDYATQWVNAGGGGSSGADDPNLHAAWDGTGARIINPTYATVFGAPYSTPAVTKVVCWWR